MKTKSKTPVKKRTRNPDAKRTLILKVALQELATYGYAGARVDRIALNADVSIGTVFKHYKDKQALANAVYMDSIRRIRDGVRPFFSHGDSPKAAFDIMWDFYVSLLFQEPELLMFYEYQPTEPFMDSTSKQAQFQLRQDVGKWIKKHQKEGVLKSISPEILRAVTFGPLMRLLREATDGNTTLSKPVLRALNEFVWDAIATGK